MQRLLIINDPHISEHPPKSRRDDYLRAIYSKLMQCVRYANSHQIDAVIITGDIFHRKYSISHYLVRGMIILFRAFNCPVYAVCGNHDIVGGNIKTLRTMPFSVLLQAGVLTLLTDKPHHLGICDLYGVGYSSSIDTDHSYIPVIVDKEKVNIVVTHGLLLPPGKTFFSHYTTWDQLNLDYVSVLLNGHYHPGTGVESYNKTLICNVGALARISAQKHDLERHPSVLLLKVMGMTSIDYEVLPLEVTPASQAISQSSSPAVEALENIPLPALIESVDTAAGLIEVVEAAEQYAPAVKERVKKYIEQAAQHISSD